jgi:hypothetical protein
MPKCGVCESKFIGWGWVIFDRNTQDSTGLRYCSEECGKVALNA